MQQQWQVVYFVKRNPERAPAAFAQVWREHSALGGDCCGAAWSHEPPRLMRARQEGPARLNGMEAS